MNTVSEYIKNNEGFVIGDAAKETSKAVAFKIEGLKSLVWFPKSICKFLKDDFYADPKDKWAAPKWAVEKKAAELGIMEYRIGG